MTPRAVAALVLAVVFTTAAYATFRVVQINDKLPELRQALSGGAAGLNEEDLAEADTVLQQVRSSLSGPLFSALRIVPIVRENIDAGRAVTEAAIPTVRDTLATVRSLDTQADELFVEGEVQLEPLNELRDIIGKQRAAVSHLHEVAIDSLGGMLLPSVWSDVSEVATRSRTLAQSATKLKEALDLAPDMLGAGEPRTYAVALLNNAELRGAGGIVSAIGTVSLTDGRLDVGSFSYYRDLADPYPYRKVDAPEDISRRFGRYWADTTLWANATASPDVPDVAEVLANLVQLTMEEEVSGVIFVDAQGLAALLDPDDDIDTDIEGLELNARELPDFVHSEAYEIYEVPQERRAALLALAPAVLDETRDELDLGTIRRLGDAASAGHMRMVSLDPEEQRLLVAGGLAGELTTDASDSVLVTLQNLGADKLDYWMRREQQHRCALSESSATCAGAFELTNEAPDGLPRYVTQGRPEPDYRGYLEVYLDEDANVTRFGVDGESVEAVVEQEDGRQAFGIDIEVPQGGSMTVAYEYELPLEGSYSLELMPQPTSTPGKATVAIDAPGGWEVVGPRGEPDRSLRSRTRLETRFEVSAAPSSGRGLTAIWDRLVRFWREPV